MPYWGRGFMFDMAPFSLLRLIPRLQDAEIEETNVYYGAFPIPVNTTSYEIQENRLFNHRIDTSNLAQNLRRFNETRQGSFLNNTIRTLLTAAVHELESHTTLFLNATSTSVLNLDQQIRATKIFFLWDPDDSVRQFLSQMRHGHLPTEQPFTGDEIMVSIQIGYFQETLQGSITTFRRWSFENGENATATLEFMDRVLSNGMFHGLLRRAGVPLERLDWVLGPSFSNVSGAITRGRPTIDILQMRLEDVAFMQHNGRIGVGRFNTTLQETHLVGIFAWNDTNGDNKVDQWLDRDIGGRSTVGNLSELTMRFDFFDFSSAEVEQPTLGGESISFGLSLSSISGRLVPIKESADVAFLERPADALNEHLTYFNTSFSFKPDAETGEAALKLDFAFGEWNDSTPLDDLSLTLLFASSFTTFHKNRTIYSGQQEFNPDSSQSSDVDRISFFGNDEWGYLDLNSDQYLWNESETKSVLGTVIPLDFAQVTMSQSEAGGRLVQDARQSIVDRSTVLYGITYPDWGGKTILHDPTFSVYAGTPLTTLSEAIEGIETVLQPGSIGLLAIATVGLVVIGIRQRIKV